MFNVNYDKKTGIIVSYQGGGDGTENVCPDGCKTLVFENSIPQMFDSNQNVTMKVDVVTKQLVFLNPVIIPQPIRS